MYVYTYVYMLDGIHHGIYEPPKNVVPKNPRNVWEVNRVANHSPLMGRSNPEQIMRSTWINHSAVSLLLVHDL